MVKLEQPRVSLEAPQPSLVRLPRHPGPGGRQITCKGRGGECRKWLGVTDGVYLFVDNDGREIVAGLPAKLRCERCGTWETVEK